MSTSSSNTPPTVNLSRLPNSLKRVSSRRLGQQLHVPARRDQLWSPSYSPASCAGAPPASVPHYVESQRRTG